MAAVEAGVVSAQGALGIPGPLGDLAPEREGRGSYLRNHTPDPAPVWLLGAGVL
jgi:hypothetical protein